MVIDIDGFRVLRRRSWVLMVYNDGEECGLALGKLQLGKHHESDGF